MMFYGSQTSTGPGVATIVSGTFFGGAKSQLIGALRPKESLYIPEMDLTGGAGTGLGSANVMAAVNLLKRSDVEGYHANIYSNVDGVPTVGNGLTFVVKGIGGRWSVLPENQIKDLLRDAGLPEGKYDDLPLNKLSESASLLNLGLKDQAKTVFGKGEDGGFSLTPAEADKLSAAYVVRDVLPRVVTTLGADSFADMLPGEFAAVASKVYQSPGWLNTKSGKDFVEAWREDDSAVAQAALGAGNRGKAEANAYAGHISITNDNLSIATGTSPTLSGGHWEESTQHDEQGNVISSNGRVWVIDESVVTNSGSATSIGVTSSGSADASAESSRTPYRANSNTVHHADGDTTVSYTAKAGSTDGSIRKGDFVTYVRDADGRTAYLGVTRQEGNETTLQQRVVDPLTGEVTLTYSQWAGLGPASLQFQGQWDVAGNRVGDRYTQDGETYSRVVDAEGVTRWLNERGKTRQEWLIDPENPHGENAANGSDLQSDHDAGASEEKHAASDFGKALIDAFQRAQNVPISPGTQYADAGSGTASDAGGGENSELANSYSYTDFLNGAGANLTPTQQDALAQQLNALYLGGASGENLLSFITLPGGSTVITNVDGEIIGEISALKVGFVRLVSNRINEDGSTQPYTGYVAPNGQPASEVDYQKALDAAQASEAASAVGLMNSIIGLQHWDAMSDLQRTAAIASIYNVVDKLTGGELPGELGGAVAVMGLLNALDKGDIGGIAISGIAVVDHFGQGMASDAIGQALGMDAANVIPGLNLVLAIDSGNPVSVLAAAANFIPVYGQLISVAFTILGGLFGGDEDIPMREGQAHAQWDVAGNTIVVTDQDVAGGGATATGWMQSLVDGLQNQLADARDVNGNSYALIPNLLPAIGYQYDPDGFNLANGARGFVYLKWTDENGVAQTRYYDGAGNRGDDSGETLASDFMQHARGAIAPAWQAQTVFAHYRQGQGIHLPGSEAGLPQLLSDGIHQSVQILTLTLPVESALQNALVDIDGDGYLERTQWLAANQQALAVDSNGDGVIGVGELLNVRGGSALNSLNWLDANNDGLLDLHDPAFAALRLWMDVNGDGNSRGETLTLNQAGITAIDLASNPPAIVRADGSRTVLTAQTLTGDVLGLAYKSVTGGILGLQEQSGAPALATLYAVNTRQFDGQVAHINGGVATTKATGFATSSTVDAGDSRLTTTTARIIAAQGTQTSTALGVGDARVQSGAAGNVLAGQAAGAAAAGASQVRGNGIVFVSAGNAGLVEEVRQATSAMIQSAIPGLFDMTSTALPLAAVALGAAAVQWPNLVSAAEPSPTSTQQPDTPSATQIGAINTSDTIDWSVWDGARVGAAGAGPLASYSPGIVPPVTGTAVPRPAGSDIYVSNQAEALAVQAQEAIKLIAIEALPLNSSLWSTAQPSVGNTQNYSPLAAPDTATAVLADFPRVHGEQVAGVEDTVLRFAESLLLANDSTLNVSARPNEPGLRITSVFSPVHGRVSLQANAQGMLEVVFAPEANYHGPAQFSYTVTDQYGLSNNASVSLQLAVVNDAPVAAGENASGDEDNTLFFTAASLLANDSDVDSAVDGDVLRITRVGLAEHGQVFLQPDNTVRFVPDANYNGPAWFSYWVGDRDMAQIAAGDGYETSAIVRLTILPVNDLPVVTGEVLDSDEDIVLTINPALLLANDTDVDTATTNAEPAQVLSIKAVGNARHGSIALLPDGTLQFTPERDYFGAAGFSYVLDDGHGGQVQGQVLVNLAPVNDAPVMVGETVSFDEDNIQIIAPALLLTNDSDVDNPHGDLHIISVGNATHGTVGLNPDGSIRFAPAADYFGVAQFTYTVSDGAGGFTVGTASLDIAPVNDAPRLQGEALTLDEDTQARFSIASLLSNDMDVDNLHDALTIVSAGNATHGTVQIVDGEIVFTSTLNFNGQASFSYTVSDGVGGLSEATVELSFNPVNDAPVANSELIWGKRDVSYTLTQAALLANDTDVESPNDLRISGISNVQHGSAVLNADGSVRFTPEAGYAGRGSFDYVVQDLDGAQNTATAQIDFSRVNMTPMATDDSFTGYEDVAFSITQAQLLVNDSDADNSNTDLRVTAVAGAQHGVVSLESDGTVRFVPAQDFYGAASFTYQVSDSDGGQTWAMVQLSVQSVNDAPIIEDIWYGRPIYGYNVQAVYGYDESGPYGPVGQTVVAISNESQARSLLSSGQLTGFSGSFYLNGHMRPMGFENADANSGDESGTLINDPYRQNGGVVAYDPDGNSDQISFSVGGSPQHGHVWANLYTASSAPASIDHTQAGPYWLGETSAWQYYSQRGDGYSGTDAFTITATDGGGASANATVYAYHTGSSAGGGGGGGKKPVTLDLDGNGLHYIGLDDSKAYFDVNNDGWREHLAWVSAEDGLLARDIGGDRVIDRFDEIAFTGYLPGAKTDLEGLVAFDSNGDGLLNRLDARWQEFGIWQDSNGDGVSQAGEFRSLDEVGISQIGLTSDHQIREIDGVTELGQSRFTWADGRTGAVGDVALPVDPSVRQPVSGSITITATESQLTVSGPDSPTHENMVASAYDHLQAQADVPLPEPQSTPQPATQLTPEHVALLMVQMINTVTAAQEREPFGCIQVQDAQDIPHALVAAQIEWGQAAQSQATQLHGTAS